MKNKYNIKKAFFDTLYIWQQEFMRVIRQPGVILIFFVASLLYPIVYGLVYKNEVVRDIPVAYVDKSHSSLSREYIRALDATPELIMSYPCDNLDEAKDLFFRHDVHGIVVISEDFSQNIHKGKQTFVSGYFDMSSFLYYKNIMSAISFTNRDFGAELQYTNLVNSGMTEKAAQTSIAPIYYEGVALFNSGGGFSSFFLPGLLVLIIYQTLMLGINALAGLDWEENNLRMLLPINKRARGTVRIVLGKALCYFSIYAVLTFYVLGFIPRLFNLPYIGNQWELFLFFVPFLLASTFLAMTLSVAMRSMESAFLLILFSSLPLLFLGGASWPQSNVPVFWKIFSYFFPSTHGIQGYIRINTMDANLYEVSKEYIFLWIQTGVYFITACWSYNRMIKERIKWEGYSAH